MLARSASSRRHRQRSITVALLRAGLGELHISQVYCESYTRIGDVYHPTGRWS
jgi:hypothetical protein